jgi:hypothetical protein
VSKPTEHIILIPGKSGWEIWTGQRDSQYSLHSATDHTRAGDIPTFPAGDITLCFPVRALTALPVRVNSEDDALFPDLATLHAERLGLRPDPMAGQLTDTFVIAREPENTTLLSVFLRTPADSDLPTRGPKEFDISARAYPVSGDVLALWQEFGRWVFAVYQQGKLLYCQATAVDSAHPDESLAREIRLSIMQLSMQGLEVSPARVLVWTDNGDLNTSALATAFGAPLETLPRPTPTLPEPLSKLLPADVRAARRTARKRLQITLAAAAVIIAYLGLIGWAGFGIWKTKSETRKLVAAANAAAPDADAYNEHIACWEELAPVIDLNHAPVDILHRIANCIPPASGLRLQTAEISATEIKLKGEAPQLQAVNTFSLKLNKATDLAQFTWLTPEPQQSTRGWEFVFTGEIPTESQP